MYLKSIIIFFLCFTQVWTILDIEHYGAVPHSDTLRDQFQNQKAIMDAIKAASQSLTQRIVKIPAKTFYSMPIRIQNVNNLKIEILGRLAASKSVKYWSKDANNRHLNFIQINNCTNIEISGGGKIDGRGHHWWVLVFLNSKKYMVNQSDRPHLINMVNCQNLKVHDLIMKNSAQFHMKLDHCHHAQIYNLNIKVNTTAQFNLFKKFMLTDPVPIFPYNTDGIDPSGADMHIYNLTVQNFDDVVVPKPSHDDDCTRNILVENVEVRLGVGMSIGSVPPHEGGSCIKNVTFRNVYMKRPFKGIYIKTNPGKTGWGNVSNIYYKNISMDRPIWWAIYLGPQQMREPGGAGPGCMIYPFDPKGTCSTQSLVSLSNITLEDVRIHKSLLYPVTLRCNVSNPCTEINFINVQTDAWEIGHKNDGNVCEFVTGKGVGNHPKISCLTDEPHLNTNPHDNNPTTPSSSSSLNPNPTISNSLSKPTLIHNEKQTWLRIFQQLENAVRQVRYQDEEDDQFTYDLKEIQQEFIEGNLLLETYE